MAQAKHDAWRYGAWALVTGASSGIGQAFADAIARGGGNVVLVARREAMLHAFAESLRTRYGVQTSVIAVDLARQDAMTEVAQRTADLDIGLVVLAAGFGNSGPYATQGVARELELVDVNCRAVAHGCAVFGPRLRARGGGAVVMLSSIVAFQGVARAANYAASKAYVQSLAEGLAREWAADRIEVIACAPGPVASGFAARAGMSLPNASSPAVVAEGTLARLGRSRTVRPGLRAKLLGGSLATAPRFLRVRIMSAIMAGMTRPAGDG